MASKSLASLKQGLQHALNKEDPAKMVVPDGPVKDQLLGSPYNKGKDLSVSDLDDILSGHGTKFEDTEMPKPHVWDTMISNWLKGGSMKKAAKAALSSSEPPKKRTKAKGP